MGELELLRQWADAPVSLWMLRFGLVLGALAFVALLGTIGGIIDGNRRR